MTEAPPTQAEAAAAVTAMMEAMSSASHQQPMINNGAVVDVNFSQEAAVAAATTKDEQITNLLMQLKLKDETISKKDEKINKLSKQLKQLKIKEKRMDVMEKKFVEILCSSYERKLIDIWRMRGRGRNPPTDDELRRREEQIINRFNNDLQNTIGSDFVGIAIRGRCGLEIWTDDIKLRVVHKQDAEIFFELSDVVQRSSVPAQHHGRRGRLQPEIGHVALTCEDLRRPLGRIKGLRILLPNADVKIPARIAELSDLYALAIECPISVKSSRFYLDLLPEMPNLTVLMVNCWVVEDAFDLNVDNRSEDLDEQYDAVASELYERHWQNQHLRETLTNLWSSVLHKCPNLLNITAGGFFLNRRPNFGYSTIVSESLINSLREGTGRTQLTLVKTLHLERVRQEYIEKLLVDVILQDKHLSSLERLILNERINPNTEVKGFSNLGFKSFQTIAASLRQYWNCPVGVERSPTAASMIENGPCRHLPHLSLLAPPYLADTPEDPQEREALITTLHCFGTHSFSWQPHLEAESVFADLADLCCRLNEISMMISKDCSKKKKNRFLCIPSTAYVSLLEKFSKIGDESMLYGVLRGTIGTLFGNTATAGPESSNMTD